MNRAALAILGFIVSGGATLAGQADAAMDRYFSIWARDARITPATVDSLYARRVVYYGKAMTPMQVYRDKRAYIQTWPNRHYSVVPGSVGKRCNAAQTACTVSAILAWEKSGRAGLRGETGANTITLALTQQDGTLKIARESGTPVVRSACRRVGTAWRCSSYR